LLLDAPQPVNCTDARAAYIATFGHGYEILQRHQLPADGTELGDAGWILDLGLCDLYADVNALITDEDPRPCNQLADFALRFVAKRTARLVTHSSAYAWPAEHCVKLRNANEMMLPFFLMQLRFVNFNALLCGAPQSPTPARP
jgi:hypothetical protein